MNRYTSTILAVIVFPITTIRLLGADTPEKLTQLQESYDKAIEKAILPIRKTYIAELRKLREEFTKADNFDAAIAVDAEIKKLDDAVKVQDSIFDDTLWRNAYGDDVEFKLTGKFIETTGGKSINGRWEAVNASEAKVKRNDGTVWHFIVLPDGSITRRENRATTWKIVKR
jgi:hypothetical protein